jgi:8-oxo-dGTP pyrophosphatase MutT (NUDIX family)
VYAITVTGTQRTEIVLVVVRRGDRICVARRSHSVATSQGMWSVVTGYVEPGLEPADQAWTELDEELGLARADLRLVGSLPPVPLTSSDSGKDFLVHPFLFDRVSERDVVLNWEHTACAWVDVSRLDDVDCVPWQGTIVRALLGLGRQPGVHDALPGRPQPGV